jgi:hypothetical protein
MVARPTSIRAIAYAHAANPSADGATPRYTAAPMAPPPARGSAATRAPDQGRMNTVPAHMAYAVTSNPVYRASNGFCAVWKMPCSTAAASTTSAEAPKPRP